ncbi:trichohyalin-like [Lampris incognitus]|uniref:trichohyalin-like n=1 Tax=Lampris incognitus TaxID=2546036 RepID=UPI0024B56260|nr:trichohyalin-like [Lampris incognitus]
MSGHNRSKLTAADTGADLEIRSDSDTDLEEDAPRPPPIIAMATKLATLPAKALSVTSAAAPTSTARLTDSDADTDVKESDLALHTWALADPVNFMLDSDTDVDEEAGEAEEGEGRVSCLSGGKDLGSPLVLASTQQKCSLRSELSAPLASSMRLVASSPSSDSQENDDVVVAETQSFILESRGHQASLPGEAMHLKLLPGDEEDRQALSGGSLQLGLSDSSHLQLQAQALAMENTQAFVPIDGDVNLGSVQECGNNPPVDRNSVEDSDIEANKAYEGNGESASKSDGFGNEKQLDFALQATQPYLLEPYEEEERINKAATAETQQFFFPPITTLAMAETQPMSASGEEGEEKEDLVGVKSSTVCQISRKQNEGEERDETDETIQAEEGLTSSDISTAETQPLDLHDAEESDDEDSVPVVRKRKAKPLRPVEEEESQLIPGSEPSDADTQPMFTHDNKEEEDEKIIKPLSAKRKGRSQSGKPELSTSTHTSTAKTKPEAAEEAKANKQRATGRPQRGKGGRESDAGTSSSSWGGRLVRGIRLGKEEERGKPSELPKKQTTGKGKSLFSTRGRRGEIRPEEEVEDSKDEKVRQAKRGKKPTKRRGNEQEERERKEEEGVEMEQQEQAVKDRLLKEQERSERALKEQEERERLEEERKVMEERERIKQREQERLDREKAEREEKRLEREERERMERERKELQKMEREKKEREEIERLERKELEERERLERERKEREETERMERERKEREEIERKELEKREILEREKKKREEQERKEQEQQARQREKNEKEERERLEKEKKQQEREVTEKGLKEQKARDEEHKPKASKRVSRAARRSVAAATEAEPELDLNISNSDGVPARRTRSRSNSASSERSASGVTALQSKGRGRGRGAKTTSQPVPEITTRHSNRRCTVAGDPSAERGTTEQKTDDNFPPGVLSRSNSLNAEPSGYSPSSQSRGKRGRGRKRASEPEEDSIPAVDNQNDHSPAPKATARGRKSQKVDSSSDVSPQIHKEEKACFQQPGTTRGRKRGSANDSEHAAAAVTDEEDQRAHNLDRATNDSFLPQSNVKSKGRGQKAETIMIPVTALFTNEHEVKENGRQKGRKRELEEMLGDEEGESSGSKISRGKANARGRRTEATAAEEEERKSEAKEVKPAPAPASRGGRASTTQGRRNAKEPFAGEEVKKHTQTIEVEIVDGRFEGTQSVTHTKKADREEGGTTSALVSMDRDASSESPEVPQTPTGKASNKRAAPMGSSPVAKTPRTPSASPRATSRIRAFKQSYKVLFTGVTDEAGENVVGRLGGSLATGVADVTHLVTDKVRRTVKFLCAMARGVPIVTTDWLVKCGKAGSFLCPDVFIVNDKEQEKKFNFCLEKSLRIASSQPLLQGYNIHVTKSVKPEPMHMKDIICCSGATFLPKMPSSHKAQTIVISCEEDWSLCGPALAASLPVVTAEFILTGILQQKIDFETHSLPAPTIQPQAVGGRGRGRKKS